MTYKEVRDLSLQLINQYSISGNAIPGTYNNQDDYLARIPGLVNDALVYLATTSKRLMETTMLFCEAQDKRTQRAALPGDLFEIRRVFGMQEDGEYAGISNYVRVGDSLLIPKGFHPVFLDYCRYPRQLSLEPKNEDVLDVEPDAATAIPYYVAAHLVLYDDPKMRDVLMDEFEVKLIRLRAGVTAQQETVSDVYRFSAPNGGCYDV